jgi:hypothetical protein
MGYSDNEGLHRIRTFRPCQTNQTWGRKTRASKKTVQAAGIIKKEGWEDSDKGGIMERGWCVHDRGGDMGTCMDGGWASKKKGASAGMRRCVRRGRYSSAVSHSTSKTH